MIVTVAIKKTATSFLSLGINTKKQYENRATLLLVNHYAEYVRINQELRGLLCY
jgi:hypothetical protein